MNGLSNKIRVSERGDIYCLSFLCELESSTITELREALSSIDEIEQKNILVDLSGVAFVDSHGVGFFASLLKSTHAKDGILAFSGVQDQPKAVLEMVGFNSTLVKFYEDSSMALAALTANTDNLKNKNKKRR